MSAAHFSRLSELFREARRLDPMARRVWLDDLEGSDVTLRTELAGLLEADAQASPLDAELLPGLRERLESMDESGDGPSLIPDRIGHYRVIREIGRGGMGVVYEAEQDNPRRLVALKLLATAVPSKAARARFAREAEALARLQHPGIAQVFEAGVADTPAGPTPFLAMERLRGVPPTDFAASQKLDRRARLRLLAAICDAVDHAHRHGVLHRDLKPANVLVEAAADGSPRAKVLDFGVARIRDEEHDELTFQTMPGQVVGTLAYASPEQVAGRGKDVDERSDVYALGVMLYELLTSRLPYDLHGRSLTEAAEIVCHSEPRYEGDLRGDLGTILRVALAKEPGRRYRSAAALAEDIRNHLDHRPITARRPSGFYFARKFARRNRGVVAGLVLAFLALTGGLAATLVQASRAEAANRRQTAVLASLDGLLKLLDTNPTRRADLKRELGPQVTFGDAVRAWAADFEDRQKENSDPLVEAEIRRRIGRALYHAGDWVGAVRHLQKAVDILTRERGADHGDTLEAELWLVWTRAMFGYPCEGYPAALRIMAGLERVHGPDYPEICWAAMCAGISIGLLGDGEAEVKLCREMLERIDTLGIDFPRFMVRSVLAEGLSRTGQLSEALTLSRAVLEECAREAGERNFGHGVGQFQLAVLLLQVGSRAKREGDDDRAAELLAEAETTIREAVAFIKAVGGEQSDWTWHFNSVLGNVQHYVGDYSAAIETRRDLLEWQVSRFGETAPHSWLYRLQLDASLAAANLDVERMELLDEVARLGVAQSQTVGPLPYQTTSFLIWLSARLIGVDRKDDARAILEGRAPHFRAKTPGQRKNRDLLDNLLNELKGGR